MAAAIYDTVHIGGLPPGTTDTVIKQIFGQYAPIHITKVLETAPGQAVEALVGVGKAASAWLVQNLNGNIPQGMSTPVTIQLVPAEAPSAEKTEPRHEQAYQMVPAYGTGQMQQEESQYGKGKGKSDIPPHVTLHISGLPSGLTEENVSTFFEQYGDVYNIRLEPPSAGKMGLTAIIRMPEFEGQWCVENLNNFQPDNFPGPIGVSFPIADKGKGGAGKGFDHGMGEAYSMNGGSTLYGKGEYGDGFSKGSKGDLSKSWGEKGDGNWDNGSDVKSVFGGPSKGTNAWSWGDKGSSKGSGGKEKGWGKEKGFAPKGKGGKTDGSDSWNWGTENSYGGSWGKGYGKSPSKGKGKKPGPY